MGNQQNGHVPLDAQAQVKHPEFSDESMIFSSDAKKVQAQDFTLLRLVGKGNFASVKFSLFFTSRCFRFEKMTMGRSMP